MYFRNFSVALVSSLVASGAYFVYRGNPTKDTRFEHLDSVGNFPGPSQQTLEAQRKALVVGTNELYTGTIAGDAPLSKPTDDYGRRVLEMMDGDQATKHLRQNEESYWVNRGKGVVRYDVVQLASNDPIEDDHAEKIVEVPQTITPQADGSNNNDWMFWGVFDGHSGWTTSAKLRQALISFVARELNSTYSTAQKQAPHAPIPTPSSIDAAIKRGFVALDSSIVDQSVAEVFKSKSKPQAASLLAPALSGSCALLSFYDSASKTLRVACTGDSRAILGRRCPADNSKWIAMPLSVDQTGANEAEAARLRAEHPGEPDVVRAGRVLGGLEPTRAFGDASYKWQKETQDRIKRDYFGRAHNPMMRTPPYVTAEPVITSTKVQPESGDFVVMATDGLWEMLTNEEVVGLVGQWLERHPNLQSQAGSGPRRDGSNARANSWLRSWFSSRERDLPVSQQPLNSPANDPLSSSTPKPKSGQRAPVRQQQWGMTRTADNSASRFVVQDMNVATHLIRNALGGKDKEMMCALLTLPSPYSRRYRDDLTVEVIFFGDGEGGGDASANNGSTIGKHVAPGRVTVNEEATAAKKGGGGLDEVKAKL